MDPTSREDLSALMDGELAAEPTRFLLRRLDHDPELSATWSRWHLIRACLAADPARMATPAADAGFASRVAAAVAHERAAAPSRRHWARYLGGGAIAAGVAVAALLFNNSTPPVGNVAAVAQSQPAPGVALPAVGGAALTPWSLARQPVALTVQPAAANVVYGTGLMQPDYLRRAAYAQHVSGVGTSAFQSGVYHAPLAAAAVPAPASTVGALRH